MDRLFLSKQEKSIVSRILKRAPIIFYAFGSRVTGNVTRGSDLDLAYYGPIDTKVLNQLIGDFEESDLIFTVDIVDLNKTSNGFQESIKETLVEITLDTSPPLVISYN